MLGMFLVFTLAIMAGLGTYSRAFYIALVFLIMQALMILCVLLYVVSLSKNLGVRGANGMFWTFVSILLLMIMPLRGFGTVYNEVKENTIELIFLTRLSAWRIVAGKWGALCFQTLLLFSALLPYVVLRYFLGSIDFFVYYHHPAWVEAFGRTIAEAAATASSDSPRPAAKGNSF